MTMIRQPIIVVMGHVDHGKTSLLDRIRSTTIAAKEAGGITQHIGASEVPIDVINKICGPMLKASGSKINLPGLLFIDTPGHEAFTNLRKRGGSVADIAILVVDISKGFEPQTIEAINILKEYKTPFIIAANKIDLITGWIAQKTNSVMESLAKQNDFVKNEFDNRMYQMMGKLSELGFGSEVFNKVKDFKTELAIVPLSAKTGEGIAEILMVVTGLAQKYLESELETEAKGPGKGSILEKKEVVGLGITIDVILYDGTLHVNDTIAFATPAGVATAKIKALLKPKPLSEIRESSTKFYSVNEIVAASGVKISGTGLDDAMPGSPVVQVTGPGYEKEITKEIGDLFETDKKGVVLKADSIGSIEAISRLLKSAGFGVSKKGIGNVTKRDILDAFTLNATDPLNAVVLAFSVRIDEDAKESIQSSGVNVIEGNVIYKLLDDYKLFVEEKRKGIVGKVESSTVFPAQIKILPDSTFRISNPAVFGVEVKIGRIKPGYVLINEKGEVIGKIKEIQAEKTPLQIAKKGDDVAISVDGPTFGRQIKENQMLYTRVTDADERLLLGDFSNLIDNEEKELLKKIIEIKRMAKRSA
jgi:translation initiation factor 5B